MGTKVHLLSRAASASDETASIGASAWQLRCQRNAILAAAVFLAAAGLAYRPGFLDFPVTRLLNSFAGHSAVLDELFYDFDAYFTFSGVVLIALVWSCWFKTTEPETRARLLLAAVTSIGAGIVSRFLQYRLPTHPRPYYDPALGFHSPPGLEGLPYNTWNSFPSDHVALFSGLAVAIYLVRPKAGIIMACWLILVESSRTYMGAHYPSDLMGGAALGAAFVWGAQMPSLISAARRVVRWESASPSMFYLGAFFLSYQMATLFADIRSVAAGILQPGVPH